MHEQKICDDDNKRYKMLSSELISIPARSAPLPRYNMTSSTEVVLGLDDVIVEVVSFYNSFRVAIITILIYDVGKYRAYSLALCFSLIMHKLLQSIRRYESTIPSAVVKLNMRVHRQGISGYAQHVSCQ